MPSPKIHSGQGAGATSETAKLVKSQPVGRFRPTPASDIEARVDLHIRSLDFGPWPLSILRRQGARIAMLDHLGVAQKRRLAQPLDGDIDNPNGGNWE